MTPRRRIWFLLPPTLLYWSDIALTLLGQPAEYWGGDRGQAIDANPIAEYLLLLSPWVFVGLAFVWASLLGALLFFWQHPVSRWIAVLVAILHASGGSSWLTRLGSVGWIWTIIYLVIAAQFSKWCWRRAFPHSGEPPA